jgi:polar amino acid transport system substrate-binding protein
MGKRYHRATEPRSSSGGWARARQAMVTLAVWSEKIATVDDLRAFSQGDYLGNGFAETHFKSLKIDWAANIDQVFGKVIAGRNDVTVAAEMVGRWTARKLNLTDQLGVLPVNIAPAAEFRLAIRKTYPDNEALLRRFDEAVKAARTEGLLKDIEAKYA